MIMVAGFFILVLSVVALGGRLGRLGLIRFERAWLVTAALAVQIPITTFAASWLPEIVSRGLHLASYALAITFVWFNRSHAGMVVLVTGALCNLAAIAANGGVMPASQSALETAGFAIESDEFENSALVNDPNLAFLGDVFAIPAGWPFANVYSIGDVLLLLGSGWLLHRVCLSRLFPGHRRKLIESEFLARLDEEAARYEEANRMRAILAEPISEMSDARAEREQRV